LRAVFAIGALQIMLSSGLITPAWAQPIRIDVVLMPEHSTVAGQAEFLGVEAGEFNPALWQAGTFNLVPDARHPFLSPLAGTYRNIYAPSAVETPTGYRLFYGAWDGIPSPPKDRLYRGTADFDFLAVQDRKTIVLPGNFGHVCNVNALRFADGSYRMFGTVEYSPGKNRPAFFWSDTTGTNWNGTLGEPYTVQAADFISITGYTNASGADKFPTSDINGINVMLHEDGVYRLYFADFMDSPGNGGTGFKIYRATSGNGKHYTYDGVALNQDHRLANDVKKFRRDGVDWYLMGLHFNGANLWYSLSTNGASFPTSSTLLGYLGADDRYIVAQGWVVRGEENQPGRRLTGVLYGAGPDTYLDKNKIFARWLQKKVVFVAADGARYPGTNSLGPNRQLLSLPGTNALAGHVEVYAEDGVTLLGRSYPLELRAGQRYQLRLPELLAIPGLTNTGVGTNGALLGGGAVDPHYTLIASANPSAPGPETYVVTEPLPSTTWLTNGPNSKWIAPVATGISSAGAYVYRTRFELDSLLPETATVTVKWAAESSGTNIALNGVRLNPSTTYRGAFSTVTVDRDFAVGTNTLDFHVRRTTATSLRTGLRVELSGHALRTDSFTQPVWLTHPTSQVVKRGTNVTFSASAVGSMPLTFQWFKDDAALPGQTNAVLHLVDIRSTDAGCYVVRVANPAGAQFSSTAVLDVLPPMNPVLGHPQVGSGGSLEFSITGEAGDRYALETSTNLLDWSGVELLTNLTGIIHFSETALAESQRYYRLRVED
jgi:hypothetical protein